MLAQQDDFSDTTRQFGREVAEINRRFASSDFRRWDAKLRAARDDKRYQALQDAAKRTKISLYLYPNLARLLAQRKLRQTISFKKLPTKLRDYLADLRGVIPFAAYNALSQKLEGGATDSEYYLALGEAGRQYAPKLARRHADVIKFLDFVSLSFSINPMALVAEERVFTRNALEALSKSKTDRDVLFLEDMSRLLTQFASLAITPDDYAYFKQNAQLFSALTLQYTTALRPTKADAPIPQLVANVLSLTRNKDLYDYYETNLNRNEAFNNSMKNSLNPSLTKEGRVRKYFPSCVQEGIRGELAWRGV